MSSLIAWAAFSPKNRILELQLQGSIIAELYESFVVAALDTKAETAQEDKLDSGRSEVTISTERSRVVLELKKKEKRKKGFVAGFVLVMYNGGQGFAVQKLRDDA
jgi:hypothetical protein